MRKTAGNNSLMTKEKCIMALSKKQTSTVCQVCNKQSRQDVNYCVFNGKQWKSSGKAAAVSTATDAPLILGQK